MMELKVHSKKSKTEHKERRLQGTVAFIATFGRRGIFPNRKRKYHPNLILPLTSYLKQNDVM